MTGKNEGSSETANTNTNNTRIVTNCPVTLKPSQAKVASILKQSFGEYINTFEFRDIGEKNPAQRISELVSRGAVIDTVYKPAIDSAGIEHDKVAHYCFKGWEVSIDE